MLARLHGGAEGRRSDLCRPTKSANVSIAETLSISVPAERAGAAEETLDRRSVDLQWDFSDHSHAPIPKEPHPQLKCRADGRLAACIDGQDLYFGVYGTTAAAAEYRRLIGVWQANGNRMPARRPRGGPVTVREVLAAFIGHAEQHYRKNGRPTDDFRITTSRSGRSGLFANTPARDFGPLALESCRTARIAARR